MDVSFRVPLRSALQEPPATPTVLVIDPDLPFSRSLQILISSAGWLPRIFRSAEELLAEPVGPPPACLVSDVSLPGLSGLELQERLKDRPDIPLIFVTSQFSDVSIAVRAMKAGAVEFLTKPLQDGTLLHAIRTALERSSTASREERKLRRVLERYAMLTAREREVMSLIVTGLLNKQVGGRLRISECTVKVHRSRVMRKMGVGSLAALVSVATRLHTAAFSDSHWSRFDPTLVDRCALQRTYELHAPHTADY